MPFVVGALKVTQRIVLRCHSDVWCDDDKCKIEFDALRHQVAEVIPFVFTPVKSRTCTLSTGWRGELPIF